MGPKFNDSVLIRDTERHTERKEGYVNVEAEMKVLDPKVKKLMEPLEARRGEEGFLELQKRI